MNTSATAPARPALRYPGAKWRLAPWIIEHFPIRAGIDSFVEPYGGSAGVLLQLDFNGLRTYNDLDGSLVNFFRVLRSEPDKLINQIRLTPWSRAEYELAHEPTADPVEQARRLFCFCWMGIDGGSAYRSGFRVVKSMADRYAMPSTDTIKIDHLYRVAEIFAGVQIESLPAVEVMLKYDTPNALQYIDPPYLGDTRKGKIYKHEMRLDKEHERMAETVLELDSYVALSGYPVNNDGTPNYLYRDLFESHGWLRVDRHGTQTNGKTAGGKIESLWLSPKTAAALEVERAYDDSVYSLPLFAQPT
jgi:DNA adenine methylase